MRVLYVLQGDTGLTRDSRSASAGGDTTVLTVHPQYRIQYSTHMYCMYCMYSRWTRALPVTAGAPAQGETRLSCGSAAPGRRCASGAPTQPPAATAVPGCASLGTAAPSSHRPSAPRPPPPANVYCSYITKQCRSLRIHSKSGERTHAAPDSHNETEHLRDQYRLQMCLRKCVSANVHCSHTRIMRSANSSTALNTSGPAPGH